MSTYSFYFDGGSRPNPGKGAGACVLFKNSEIYHERATYLPSTTNNMAEYTGLLNGLELCLELGIKDITIKGDSLLIINQVNNVWKCTNGPLKEIYKKCMKCIKQFNTISISHVLRQYNKDADALSTLCIMSEESIDQFYL